MASLFHLDLLLIDQPQSPQTVDVGEVNWPAASEDQPAGQAKFLAGGIIQDMSDSLDRLRMSLATQVLQGDLPTEAVVQISCGPA